MPYASVEDRIASRRIWYAKNKERINAYQREYSKAWRKLNPEKAKEIDKKHRLKNPYRLKKQVCELLGGERCVYCGCTDIRLLEVNHINGGGAAEVRLKSKTMNRSYGSTDLYRDIKHGRVDKNKFNILCRLCNTLEYVFRKHGEESVREAYKLTKLKLPYII